MPPVMLPTPAKRIPEPTQPPMSDQERVMQRLAIKQSWMKGIGINWTPDDDDVRNEYQHLPTNGEVFDITKLFDAEVDTPVENPGQREKPIEVKPRNSFWDEVPGFSPTEPLAEEEDEDETGTSE